MTSNCAEQHIDLLGHTLYFLPQQHPNLAQLLRKAAGGCQIRLAIANRESPNVPARNEEEGQAIMPVVRMQRFRFDDATPSGFA